ncbi:MAG: hypothetical protein LAP61_20605 [Acidobacteriia bacterium]|nr:hypothetical protein [Terriglobia bacterium]
MQATKLGRKLQYLIVAAVLGVAPTCFAAETASMTLTGVGTNGALGGVYVGPYVGTIDTVKTQLICDDFADESYIPESWTADVYSLSDYTSLRFYNSSNPSATQIGYEEVAWLSQQLTNQSLGLATAISCTTTSSINCAGDIQYAIWAVFSSPAALNQLSSGDPNRTNAQAWLDQAALQYSTGDYSNVSIYTAVPGTAMCGTVHCPSSPLTPQEFVVVRTPEPPGLAVLGIDFSAIGVLILFFRRKITN